MIAAFCRLVVDDIKCRGSAQEAWFGHFSVSLIYSDNGNGQITLKIFHGSHPTIVGGNSDWQVLHNLFAFLSNRTPKLQGDVGREKEGDLSTNHCHSVMPLKERPFNQSGHSFTLSLSYPPLCLSLSLLAKGQQYMTPDFCLTGIEQMLAESPCYSRVGCQH